MKTIEQAAKEYAKIPIGREVDSEERYFNSNVVLYDAFKAGVEFATRWIPVEEELPEKACQILVRKSNGLVVGMYHTNNNLFIYNALDQTSQVTHWRPINLE